MALGAAQDYLVHLALTGSFEPIIYQGEFQYAARQRTLCKLEDGTTAFADELPQGALVIERRTVTTRDGEMLGRYRRDKRLLRELVVAWMPEQYGSYLRLMPEKDAPPVRSRFEMSARGLRIVEDPGPAQPGTHAAKLKTAFLMAFICSCSVTDAARSVGIDRAIHYKWLATDAKYKAAYEASKPAAAGRLEDHLITLALTGIFEPAVYGGQFHYAERRRILCKLTDGTAAFADELPKGARVIERRTVTTRDGEMVGVYRLQTDLLIMLLEAWLPEEFGKRSPRMMPEKTTVCLSREKLMDLLERRANAGGVAEMPRKNGRSRPLTRQQRPRGPHRGGIS
jgi:hypothetical protein